MEGTSIGLSLRLDFSSPNVDFKLLAKEVVVVKVKQGFPYVLHRILKAGSADEPVLLGGRIGKCLDSLGLGDELGFLDQVTQRLLDKGT